MAHQKTGLADAESILPDEVGDMWFLKDPLDTAELGFTVLDLEPGASGKEHSHEGQEEVYYVVEGGVTVEVEGESVPLDEEEALRIDPEDTRTIVNGDDRSRLVLVGAPRDAN